MAASLNHSGRLRADDAPKLLVPDYAAKAPAPVVKANVRAAEAVAVLERAQLAWAEAAHAARETPRADARAGAAAHRDGTKLPDPTVATAAAAAEAADRTRDLARRECDRALGELHDTILAHREGWLPAVERATDDAGDAVLAKVGELRELLTQQAGQTAVEKGLRRLDPASESAKVRTLFPIGTADERREQLLAVLVDAVRERASRPVEPAVKERQAAEELKERARGLNQMASRGGLHVR